MTFDPVGAINSALGYVDALSRSERHQWRRFGKDRIDAVPLARFQCIRCLRFTVIPLDDAAYREEAHQIEQGAAYGYCGHPAINEWWKAGGAEGPVILIDGSRHFDIKDEQTGAIVRVPFGTPDETEPTGLVDELRGATP